MTLHAERTAGGATETATRIGRLLPALLAALVSGVAVFVNGLAVRRFDDATVYTTAKNLVAGIVLAGVLVAVTSRTRGNEPTPTRTEWPWLAVVALIGGAVPFVLFFEGLAMATSTDAAFIHKTLVVWVAIGATVALGERIGPVHVLAIALLLAGHAVVAGGVSLAGFGAGEAMIFAATLIWAVEVVIVKRLLTTVSPSWAASTRMLGGSALLLVWLALRGDLGALGSFTINQWWWLALTGATLAVFVSIWYRALALAPATDVTAVLVIGAAVTAALNSGFRGIPISSATPGYLLMLLGAAVVIAHGSGTSRPDRRRADA
jgi:drug/metabolite transporter (DMT)-like permease